MDSPTTPESTARGNVVWFSSDEDSGPDCGLSVGLGNGHALYIGELANQTLLDSGVDLAAVDGGSGWWVALETPTALSVVGPVTDVECARQMLDQVAASLLSAQPQPGAGEVSDLRGDDLLRRVIAKKLDRWALEMQLSASAMRAMGAADVAKGNDDLAADLTRAAALLRSAPISASPIPAGVSEEDVREKVAEAREHLFRAAELMAERPMERASIEKLQGRIAGGRGCVQAAGDRLSKAFSLLQSRPSPAVGAEPSAEWRPKDEHVLIATTDYCSWCGDAILPGQPTATSDGERMHIGCAAEDMDNACFDRDLGDS